MQNTKKRFLADQIHYPIMYSEMERKVISTQRFNRLHNVLQNSTAYLTYPSLRTSRFSHSLGTMHIAGRLFKFSFLNATPYTRQVFLDSAIAQIEKIKCDDKRYTPLKTHYLWETTDSLALQSLPENIEDPLYDWALPGTPLKDEEKYAYLCSFQATRLAALLHDIGHPPFSHVSEQSLGELFDEFYDTSNNGGQLTTRQQGFLDLFIDIKNRDRKLHEYLGEKLLGAILGEVVRSIHEDGKDGLCHSAVIIKLLAEKIFDSKTPSGKLTGVDSYYSSLHSIIDSDLDADRLDFIARDLQMSGLNIIPFRSNRLISTFELVCEKCVETEQKAENEENYILRFVPSVRALSSIEELFQLRLKLYTYIVFHHRVKKTDWLLKQSIKNIAEQHLAESTDDTANEGESSSDVLVNEIQGLWSVLSASELLPKAELNRYVQWDDSWLMTALRTYYFTNFKIDSDGEKPEALQLQLEELLANEKRFSSLIKRGDSFLSIDLAFLDSFVEAAHIVKFETYIEERIEKIIEEGKALQQGQTDEGSANEPTPDDAPRLKQQLRVLGKYVTVYGDWKRDSSKINKDKLMDFRENQGFFAVSLGLLLKATGLQSFPFLEQTVDSWSKANKLDEYIVTAKMIGPGVDNSFLLAKDGELVRLGDVSSVATELIRRAKLVPPFFVFIFRERGIAKDEMEQLRIELGKELSKALGSWLGEMVPNTEMGAQLNSDEELT